MEISPQNSKAALVNDTDKVNKTFHMESKELGSKTVLGFCDMVDRSRPVLRVPPESGVNVKRIAQL